MPSDHHASDLALRSPKMTLNWDFEQSVLQYYKASPPNQKKKDLNSEVL